MGRRLRFKPENILSMDSVRLANYIRKRFDPSTNSSNNFDETKNVSYQILANKTQFETNWKAHLKTFYTLIKACHAGHFSKVLFRNSYIGFPYLNEYYKMNYELCRGTYPDVKQNLLSNGYGDSLLLNTGEFLVDNAASIITGQLDKLVSGMKCNIGYNEYDLLYLYLTRGDTFICEELVITMLSIKTALELWAQNTFPSSMSKNLKESTKEKLDFVLSTLMNLKKKNKSFVLTRYLELFAVLVASGVHDQMLLQNMLELLVKESPLLDVKDQLLLLLALSKFQCQNPKDEIVEMYHRVVMKLISYFESKVKCLDLRDSLILVQALASLPYKQLLLDNLISTNLKPKFNLMRFEDILWLLQAFVTLDYRCLTFLSNLDKHPMLDNIGPVDFAALCRLMNLLHGSVNPLLDRITPHVGKFVRAADIQLIRDIADIYRRRQTSNEYIDAWLQQQLKQR